MSWVSDRSSIFFLHDTSVLLGDTLCHSSELCLHQCLYILSLTIDESNSSELCLYQCLDILSLTLDESNCSIDSRYFTLLDNVLRFHFEILFIAVSKVKWLPRILWFGRHDHDILDHLSLGEWVRRKSQRLHSFYAVFWLIEFSRFIKRTLIDFLSYGSWPSCFHSISGWYQLFFTRSILHASNKLNDTSCSERLLSKEIYISIPVRYCTLMNYQDVFFFFP